MTESRRVDSWVGQRVALNFYGGGERAEGSGDSPMVVRRARGTLMWVDDKGIALEAAGGGEVFYGWNAVISIRLQPS